MMRNHKEPLVSVIVPVYNSQEYLKDCVNSILTQSYQEIELILVDDQSADSSSKMCDEYSAMDDRVVVIHKKNEGAGFARKTGAELANGDYVMFVDSDDWLEQCTIEKCVNKIVSDGSDCVLFSYSKDYENKSIENLIYTSAFSYDIDESESNVHQRVIGPSKEQLSSPHTVDNLSPFWGKMYSARQIKRGRFISEREVATSEDTIFNLYALEDCKISYINECLYHYRKTNASSLINSYKPDLVDKWDVLHQCFLEYINNSENAEKYYNLFLNRIACSMIGLGLNEINNKTGIFKVSKRILTILKKSLYQKSFRQLDISYCPLKWKVFFVLCKTKNAFLLVLLLKAMNELRKG